MKLVLKEAGRRTHTYVNQRFSLSPISYVATTTTHIVHYTGLRPHHSTPPHRPHTSPPPPPSSAAAPHHTLKEPIYEPRVKDNAEKTGVEGEDMGRRGAEGKGKGEGRRKRREEGVRREVEGRSNV